MTAAIQHGMEALKDLEVFKVSFKCIKCKFYAKDEQQVASHYKLKHHGGFACRRGEYLVQFPEDEAVNVILGNGSYNIVDCLVDESDEDDLDNQDNTLVFGNALNVSDEEESDRQSEREEPVEHESDAQEFVLARDYEQGRNAGDQVYDGDLGPEVSFYGNLEPELADQGDFIRTGSSTELLSRYYLTWDPKFLCFFCYTCSTFVIKDDSYYDVSVLYNHVSGHHQVCRKEEMRDWLNEFQHSEYYAKFEPTRFYQGMGIIPAVDVVIKALKCGRCRYYGDEEDELAAHNEGTHHGGLVCRRIEGGYNVQYPFGNDTVFEVVEGEEPRPEVDTTSPEYQSMNPVEFFASKGLTFDSQLNLFYCKKCDTHIINRARNGYDEENLNNHVKQVKHRGSKKAVNVDFRLALEKFKKSGQYVQFDPRQVYNGMANIKNIKVVNLPFKCRECETFSISLSGVKRHYEKIHGSEVQYEQGSFSCQKIFPGGGFIRVLLPGKSEPKRASLGSKRERVVENVKPTISKSKRFCAQPVEGDEENLEMALGVDDGDEVEDDFNEFLVL